MQKVQTTSIMTCSVEVSLPPASTIQGLMQGPTFTQGLVFLPLQCNIDVTSLKVRSQMKRYSMIQTIYTFPGFNLRPCVFTITVFVPLQCNIDVCTITVFEGSMPGLTFTKGLALTKGLTLMEDLTFLVFCSPLPLSAKSSNNFYNDM